MSKLPNPVRRSPCGNVFPAQKSKNFHLGSGCQVTAPWTCLSPQWFDWSEAVNCPYRAGYIQLPFSALAGCPSVRRENPRQTEIFRHRKTTVVDCYRVERSSFRAGVASAGVQRLSRRTVSSTNGLLQALELLCAPAQLKVSPNLASDCIPPPRHCRMDLRFLV